MKLLLTRWAAPISPLLLVTDTNGTLRALEFADREERMHRLLRIHYGNYSLQKGAVHPPLIKALHAYFDGQIEALAEIHISTGGTPFQHEVWAALRKIPAGITASYGELASEIGRPTASRAVGAANGSNPICIVVPCHRVIGANRTLTGYAGGISRKQWLLDHETRFAPILKI